MSQWILLILLAAGAKAQDAPDLAAGRKIFESQCALCHGQTGTGGRGPSLNRPALPHAPDDEALYQVIFKGIEPEMPGAWQLDAHEIRSVAAYVRSLGAIPAEHLMGDPARGERVYQSKGCAGCHIVAGKGESYGPELTGIGARRNGANLRETLLNPASLLPEGFLYMSAVTRAGATVRGIRVNEDTFTVQIKDARGEFHGFKKSDLNSLTPLAHQTPMPSFASLSSGELDDLVSYLASLKGKP